MLDSLLLENFRSIGFLNLPLKKFNVLYGPNGSGKSSVAYATYAMRNFFVNPSQRLDSLFNLGFINLGGYENITSEGNSVSISLTKQIDLQSLMPGMIDAEFKYALKLNDTFPPSSITYEVGNVSESILIDHPYNLSKKIEVKFEDYSLTWNGLVFETINESQKTRLLVIQLNKLFEEIKNIELISVKRGFFSPIFSTEQANEEALFAMQIRDEGVSFESKIDYYFKQLFNKTFRFVAIPGSTSFYLRTQNSKGFTTDLVNEGFGVNQTLYMLIKLLKKNTSLAFIEEPEIHLHPTAQNKLVDVFTEIVQKENKQIFLTTHSENIVSSVLAKIAAGELDKNDVQFYLAQNEDDETKIIPQEINERGQVEGGLKNFMETELSNLKTMLGI
ncbi:AAA family ATPase [Foetidibacter luteolus]|uniref:AAA family ATPase n=1 Tax=Foetidibacter luteolus TaxID=2608880 RepID=UPI00129A4A02|nr:ATP-binding protein [Foetidibacter luteolus]